MSDVLVAVCTVFAVALGGGGGLTYVIKNRAARPSGWQVAVAGAKEQIADMKVQIKDLNTRVATAEERATEAEKRAKEALDEKHAKDRTIEQLTRALDAKDGRIVQLLTAWPPGSRPPAPNPAHEPYL